MILDHFICPLVSVLLQALLRLEQLALQQVLLSLLS